MDRSCQLADGRWKRVYPTREMAERACAEMNGKQDAPVSAYWCEVHQGFHCGRVRM
jgi:hypothetical protein